MKKYTLLLFALLMSLAVFTACGGGEPVAEQVGDISDQVLDESIYRDAIGQGDATKCDKIVNPETKGECGQVVGGLLLTDKAVSSMDKGDCKEIEIERYRNNCEEKVAEALTKKEKEENLEKELAENSKVDNQARMDDDESLCEQIEDSNQRNACYSNVLTNRAIQSGDITICKNMPSQSLVEDCESSFLDAE